MIKQPSAAKALAAAEFWQTPKDALYRALGSGPNGLSQVEADRRLAMFGANHADASQSRSVLRKLGQRVWNPLIAMLLAAALVSGLSGDVGSFVIIATVLSLSITLDIVQEHRAELTAEALRESVAIRADAVRDGKDVTVPVTALVPGDIVKLRVGDLIPADGIVLDAQELQINEALMTGEPFPAFKTDAPCSAASPAEATNALFAGTSTVGGSGRMLVVKTGGQTRFGAIAAALAANAPPTALEQGVHKLGLLILRLTLFLTLFVLLAHLVAQRAALESFLFAVALAVGLTPELLPMVMTVTLARGALRMADRNVIVKRLSAIHDLGAMDTLCVDKTGTLTEAKITLEAHVDPKGRPNDRVLSLAYLNSTFQAGVRSPLDDAILSARNGAIDGWVRLAEVPFDFERRCLSVLVAQNDEHILIAKGAPESILARCVAVGIDGLAHPLDAAWQQKMRDIQDQYARDGLRLLAVAVRSIPPGQQTIAVGDEADLTMIGFCVFADPPKQDAASAIEALTSLGITVKILSGDHGAVVSHVARSVGLQSDRIMTGVEISGLTDAALVARVDNIDLFARIDPDQKRRIIAALRHRHHVVGFMGDGVNDAPAIHAAHVGISVTGATEVARAAADLILLAPDLSVLAAGVREGRRTFANILKYVRMGTSSNFGNMLSMALASIVLPFLPLLPLQILLNNLIYDLSEIGIPFDEVDREDLAQPEAWNMASILRFTIIMGIVSSVFDVITFAVLLKLFEANAAQFQTGWFVESISTQILVIFIIRSRRMPWRANRPHTILVATSFGALIMGVGLALGPWGQLFGFTAPSAALVATIFAIAVTYLVCAEIAKRLAVSIL
ncbi:Mg2+-importing ATPase [Bradyrhizobium japonicum]|uniref:magnesium-translocating P-type ATPase n=1 Tax=Bradyrhizobium TaxID=374 RepID=UPI00041DA911|nr:MULTISPECIES: magnesium-translocating P-type ATPase [Bradyrhizobium]MBR0881705.1 magnesium-translocating P-type ATPase [Bradyrhizobium liaoningense]MBR1003206.1 magnesium-translocating P-type ATPase [Bradyrhizobium liaoningense]MBR1066134.1 magnesium-translocating P-type ATPase [Bradyrhizobium liaoningense]MCP1863784.1 Mg2+-importing ATPase [Bradyrhizobium japonicum]MCW2327755.1 Mg2+-importing ATPase [Bradyrhizobium japonicum]